MKKTTLTTLLILLSLNTIRVYSQASVCETTKEDEVDLNTITFNKCEITEKKTDVKRISRTRIIRKRTTPNTRLRKTSNYLGLKKSEVNLKTNNKRLLLLKLISKPQKVLFSLVDEIPMFESCQVSTREENIKCFNKTLNKLLTKNFNPDYFTDDVFNSKIFVQFQIDINGEIKNTLIKTKNKLIINELKKAIKNLPLLKSGKENGLPVIVTHSFPLNLTLN
ncbi:hypothetical protein H3Z83_10480 [Tenacibaculum sp. S7007]|uniref:TonB C-terminal domain-containing protein n=1 Tax=Tenacibaculum pelagium TaxID=2759527 RepID=A0A839APB5_9FLAO|nr:hypothetical protein [Tenacibaculum pelagium]MBA6156943.1 hypothetical protein [Tenacibaculum pelagium]